MSLNCTESVPQPGPSTCVLSGGFCSATDGGEWGRNAHKFGRFVRLSRRVSGSWQRTQRNDPSLLPCCHEGKTARTVNARNIHEHFCFPFLCFYGSNL
uniref:Uncharacterized protein n=1 Tax=Anguilla anguilla TaxID=7936 RepID=A0A0E9X675_ANGAN